MVACPNEDAGQFWRYVSREEGIVIMNSNALVQLLIKKGVISKSDIQKFGEEIQDSLRLKTILTPQELAAVKTAVEEYIVPDRLIPDGGMWRGQFNTHVQWAKDGFDLENPYTYGGLADLVMLLENARFSLGNVKALEKLIQARNFAKGIED